MSIVFFFFSSRRRHTRCALVTGVQTCALPIWGWSRAISLIRQRACRLRSSSEPIREFRLHGDGDRLAEHVLKAHGVGQRSIVDALDNPRNDAAQLRADDAVVEAAGARVKHRDDALSGEESRGGDRKRVGWGKGV